MKFLPIFYIFLPNVIKLCSGFFKEFNSFVKISAVKPCFDVLLAGVSEFVSILSSYFPLAHIGLPLLRSGRCYYKKKRNIKMENLYLIHVCTKFTVG